PISYVSPGQLNFLVPADIPPGPVQIQTTNNGLTSSTLSTTLQVAAPAFFIIGATNAAGNNYIAAEHANGTIAGPPNLITGVTTTPFTAGETIVLFANGLGPTSPTAPNGLIPPSALPLASAPIVTIGGQNAPAQFV